LFCVGKKEKDTPLLAILWGGPGIDFEIQTPGRRTRKHTSSSEGAPQGGAVCGGGDGADLRVGTHKGGRERGGIPTLGATPRALREGGSKKMGSRFSTGSEGAGSKEKGPVRWGPHTRRSRRNRCYLRKKKQRGGRKEETQRGGATD